MKKNKLAKTLKSKKFVAIVFSGVMLLGLLAAGYYFVKNQDDSQSSSTAESDNSTTTDSTGGSVTDNIDSKDDASGDAASTSTTNTDSSATDTVIVTSLTDVSLSAILDPEGISAYIYLYGPAGTYGVDKLTNGTWATVNGSFNYIGSGGYSIETISADTTYRVYLIENGTRVATSGNTTVSWQKVFNSGTLTVQLED